MGKPSTIEVLPDDILEQLQELLRDPRVTQLEATRQINAILEAQGHTDRVTKSAVNRYDLKMRKVGEKLRESREVAKMLIGKLGAAPQGQVGLLINEITRKVCFDLSVKLDEVTLNEETMPGTLKMVKDLALAVQRLETASTVNVKRETEIRKQALEAAADAVGEEAKAQGMSEEQARFWREKVLGVRN